MAQSPTIFRSYRIYLRDARNAIGQSNDVDLTSDEEAHDRALMMLGGQATYSYARFGSERGLFARCAGDR